MSGVREEAEDVDIVLSYHFQKLTLYTCVHLHGAGEVVSHLKVDHFPHSVNKSVLIHPLSDILR